MNKWIAVAIIILVILHAILATTAPKGNNDVLSFADNITNNENAINVSWLELRQFLFDLDEKEYTTDYVCRHFARDAHDAAEANGIKAAYVRIIFTDSSVHAVNGFATTDMGFILYDTVYNRVVYATVGESYWIGYTDPYLPSDEWVVSAIEIYW